MKIQILPHWYKRLGLVLFVVFSILGGGDDFIDGWNSVDCNLGKPSNKCVGDGFSYSPEDKGDYFEFSDGITYEKSKVFRKYFSDRMMDLFTALSGVALFFILLAKEKVEDEYINNLRLQAFQLTAFIGLALCVFLLLFNVDMQTYLILIIYLYVIVYLIIFNIKLKISNNN